MLSPYRVLLLKPKLLAKDYGREVVYLQVEEESPDEAIIAAQQQASEEDSKIECEPGDWYPLLVIEGYEENRLPALEPDHLFRPDHDEASYLSHLLEGVARDAPTLGRSALALRLIRKLKKSFPKDGTHEIVLNGIELRVLQDILYGISIKIEADGGKEPEMVHRLCIRLIAMLPASINEN